MKFYVHWGVQSKSWLSYTRRITGEVIINSQNLKKLCNLLPLKKEYVYKGITYYWDGERLKIKGKFKCVNPSYFSECWGIDDPWGFYKAPIECRTKCPIMRITQSLFTYLAKIAKEKKVEELSDFSTPSSEGEGAKSDNSSCSPDTSAKTSADASTEVKEQEQQQSCSCSRAEAEEIEAKTEVEVEAEAEAEVEAGKQEGKGSAVLSSDAEPPRSKQTLEGFSSEDPEEGNCQVRSSSGSDNAEGEGSPAPAGVGAGEEEDSLLDSYPAGAHNYESGQQESQNEPGWDSSPDEEALSSNERASKTLESKSLWEVSYTSKEDQHSYEGGSIQARALTARDSSTTSEKEVLYLLRRFFSEMEDFFRKKDGFERWDAKKVIRSLTVQPIELPRAKFSRQKSRKISFWVDVSASVDYLAEFIIAMITAACKNQDIQVVIGSEAHPQRVIDTKEFLHSNKDWWKVKALWETSYIPRFHIQVRKFLRENPLPSGSTIVIWSDYMDINATNLKELSFLLKPYKVVWLCSHQGKDPDYCGNESFKIERFAQREGHLFLWGIDSPQGIKRAIKQLSIRNTRRRCRR